MKPSTRDTRNQKAEDDKFGWLVSFGALDQHLGSHYGQHFFFGRVTPNVSPRPSNRAVPFLEARTWEPVSYQANVRIAKGQLECEIRDWLKYAETTQSTHGAAISFVFPNRDGYWRASVSGMAIRLILYVSTLIISRHDVIWAVSSAPLGTPPPPHRQGSGSTRDLMSAAL
ncbi:hypothetical protein M434DRAFT_34970 [Hypoxylon sp. CO27-5]|nr:hypothetical protein M434DRAFT_34970 [Hypoxylon sp. CO27-5]